MPKRRIRLRNDVARESLDESQAHDYLNSVSADRQRRCLGTAQRPHHHPQRQQPPGQPQHQCILAQQLGAVGHGQVDEHLVVRIAAAHGAAGRHLHHRHQGVPLRQQRRHALAQAGKHNSDFRVGQHPHQLHLKHQHQLHLKHQLHLQLQLHLKHQHQLHLQHQLQ